MPVGSTRQPAHASDAVLKATPHFLNQANARLPNGVACLAEGTAGIADWVHDRLTQSIEDIPFVRHAAEAIVLALVRACAMATSRV